MATGARVLQVNTSAGGVPKTPVEQAWVGRLGVEGDAHRDRTDHGGPHRAVCLFGIEAIERLQAEGHPVEPGSVGENLTTVGVEWSLLPVGTRARIGKQLLLELASPTLPCSTQRPNFLGGRYSRISIELHPADSRMYARVIREGPVRAGYPIDLLPPAPDSRAEVEQWLGRLDYAEAKSSLATWRAAQATGHDVRIVADGELMMAASPQLPGPEFNQALGLARMPHLVTEAEHFFDEHQAVGWIVVEPSAEEAGSTLGADDTLVDVFAGEPSMLAGFEPPAGMRIRPMAPADLPHWAAVREAVEPDDGMHPRPARWAEIAAAEIESPHLLRLLAEDADGRPLGAVTLYVHHRTGWLRGAWVVPASRGRGLQRALITARAQAAVERDCDLVGAWAEADGVSAANLTAAGLRVIGYRLQRRYVPAPRPAALAEADR